MTDPDERPETTGDLPPELDPRHLLRRVVQIALIGLVVIVAVSALPGLGEVRERFAGARPGWLVAAVALELGSVAGFVAAFRGVFCRNLGWRLSVEIATAEQAANVLAPAGGAGGLALGAWALRRGGMATGHIARRSVAFFLITSAVNFAAAIIAGTLLALGVGGSVAPALGIVPAALAAIIALGVVLLARVLARVADRPGGRVRRALTAVSSALGEGMRDAGALVRSGDVLVIAGAVGYMALDVAALGAAFHAFGGGPPAAVLVLAYTVGQLGDLVPVPGGIGGTDGALIGTFVVYGTSAADATAAVLAYRAVQIGLPAIVGTAGFIQLRRTLARSADPAALCAPMAAGALR